MATLRIPEHHTRRPEIQMAPLIDIVFITLVFFMTMSVLYQMENELSVSVPKAKESKEVTRSPGEIVINILKDGTVIVNQSRITNDRLQRMLKEISGLYPNQPVIIRADQNAFHKYVIKVLDACASADIWNVSFATLKEEGR